MTTSTSDEHDQWDPFEEGRERLGVKATFPAAGGESQVNRVENVPILAYHSHRIEGTSYETNDHIALFHDLRTIHAQGFRVVPLMWVVEWVLGRREDAALDKAVAISFDDGADLDYYDCEHGQYGPVRSFYNILRDFQAECGSAAQPDLHASAFVIASPIVRKELAERCLAPIGLQGMSDNWWGEAHRSGIMSIYNHSWDHNHPEASTVCEKNQNKGSFALIDTYAECQGEVQQAAEYIHQKTAPAWPELFAYPWGQASGYLRETYFPSFGDRHRTIAAFGANGGYVTSTSSRWDLPRFVCGSQLVGWQSTERLIQILHGTW
jgi:hypothetical protein